MRMMKALPDLPNEYRQILFLDLQKNKKTALLVNLMALLIAAGMIIPAAGFVPIHLLFDDGWLLFVILGGMVVYMILHEWTHGAVMKCFSQNPVKFGFTGLYAYAGSTDYFPKLPYLTVALAPLVLWGILLSIPLPFLDGGWFWVVYMIQVMNVSGAAGDLYVSWKLLFLPKNVLVQDSGISMTFYA